jgi:hypothetical protein
MLPFNLDIVPLDKIIPLEKYHPSRANMIKNELMSTDHLINPLLVTQLDNGSFLLLQGINSYQALKSLGINDTVIQIIGPESDTTQYMSWSHLVRNLKSEYFLQIADELKMRYDVSEGLTYVIEGGNRKQITCVFFKGISYKFEAGTDGLIEQAKIINRFIESYQANSSHLRLYPDNLVLRAVELFENENVLINLPRYSRNEIIRLADAKVQFPLDYINLNLENRVVGLDYPINVLRSNVEIEEKRSFLNDLIRMRLLSNRSMVFGGKVFYMGRWASERMHTQENYWTSHVQWDSRPE